jgi:hypothetical protein
MAKPCIRCGGVKCPGPGQRYCPECKAIVNPTWSTSTVEPTLSVGIRRTRVKAADGFKWCSRCQKELRLSSFSGKAAYCIPCSRSHGTAYRLKTVYNMTTEQYAALLAHQGGVCAGCGMKPKTRKLAVDHCHKTNRVRGLLCKPCNSGVLASAKDNAETLRNLANYLDNPPAFSAIGEIETPELANKKRAPRRRRTAPWTAKRPAL